MKEELWLQVDYVQERGMTTLSWYNEGRASEFGYFLKLIWKRIIRKYSSKMQYIIRYGEINIKFSF